MLLIVCKNKSIFFGGGGKVIQKILDGESLTYALEETITIVEVLMTTFEFTYLASQLGLVFAANRTGRILIFFFFFQTE